MKTQHTTLIKEIDNQISFLLEQIDCIHKHVRELLKEEGDLKQIDIFLNESDILINRVEDLQQQKENLANNSVLLLQEIFEIFYLGEMKIKLNLN